MKYAGFHIENFKGIEELSLDLNFLPNPNIFTLVGLNESGKTTILEAIDFLHSDVKDVNALIPKSKKRNFNGIISIKADVIPNANDEKKIKDFASGLGVKLSSPIGEFSINKVRKFVNSEHDPEEDSNLWTISIKGTKTSEDEEGNVTESEEKVFNATQDPEWKKIIHYIQRSLLPKIVYYPNFLFDFPKSIYLEETAGESKEQKFYREVLQDVLDSLDDGLDLETHLLERVKSSNSAEETEEAKSNAKETIEAVLLAMSAQMTRFVFQTWGSISGTPVENKEVTLGNVINKDSDGNYYVEIKIKEGSHSFNVSERSLGFRWFFAFLLATQFRKYRKNEVDNTLFLLDEPASNLHSTGQQELLSSLEKLTDGCMVIYSTHSHHMINPKWLSGAFIVKNKGIDIEKNALQNNFVEAKTDIEAERYHRYVAQNPKEETYFQPILDTLDYRPGMIEQIPEIVILEGKFDYYTFKYFQDHIFKRPKFKLHLYPGAGASKHEDIIALYLAWGRKLLVLLDDDRGGKECKKKYIKDFGKIMEDRVFTLGDISNDFAGYTTENLFDDAERTAIMQSVFPAQVAYEKSKFNTAIQELYMKGTSYNFADQTKANLKKVFEFLENKLSTQ